MKLPFEKAISAVGLTCALGAMAWSPSSFACAAEPYLASVCAMALPAGGYLPAFGNNQYMQAAGQQLSIQQYTALYALIGVTYGGDAQTNFKLPDLRGRVIVGYDGRTGTPAVGATGGAASIKLTVAQLPPHLHAFTNQPVAVGSLSAATTLSSLNATANLSGLTLTGTPTGLLIKASSQNGIGTPNGNFIGKSNGGQANIYSSASPPDSTLNSGSIVGPLSFKLDSGISAPVTVSGTATTTLSGAGATTGTTEATGGAGDVPTMPPYMVMPYFIATNGIFPSRNN